jgi:hypothetical protein
MSIWHPLLVWEPNNKSLRALNCSVEGARRQWTNEMEVNHRLLWVCPHWQVNSIHLPLLVFLRIEQLIGAAGHLVFWIKYEQSHISLWPHDSCGQELYWADTGSEARDRPPDGSPSCQYKSWPTKNFVNRITKKNPAPPSPVTKKWIQEFLHSYASAWLQASH